MNLRDVAVLARWRLSRWIAPYEAYAVGFNIDAATIHYSGTRTRFENCTFTNVKAIDVDLEFADALKKETE